ncbi:MAG: NADPH-dependent FMN reductase [Pseudomonadales bacterium]
MKILAFGASNSKQSINRQLANYAANLVSGAEVELLDLNDYEMPLFSIERELALGQPELALAFRQKIAEADALVISFAEHNGSYSVAYKNLFDWTSRIDGKVFQGKPVVYLSTSPGGRGGAGVLAAAANSAPHFGAELIANMSVPSFFDNFDVDAKRPSNTEIEQKLKEAMGLLEQVLNE